MFRSVVLLSVVLLFFALPSWAFEKDYEGNFTGFPIVIGGTYTNPVRLSDKGYDPGYGFFGRIGMSAYGLNGMLGGSFFLGGESNAMLLKGSSARVNIYDIHLGGEFSLFIFKYGGTFGGLRLSMPDDEFQKNGGSTLTELAHENRKIQKCESFLVGVKIPLALTRNDFLSRFAFDYEYRALSADRAWMFWHDLLSSMIMGTGFGVLQGISDNMQKQNNITGVFFIKTLEAGLWALTWYYDYDYHNLPFQDEKPFRFHRHSFSLTFLL